MTTKSYTLWYRNNVVPDCQNKTYKVCNARKTVLGNSGGYDKNRFEILQVGVKPKVKERIIA